MEKNLNDRKFKPALTPKQLEELMLLPDNELFKISSDITLKYHGDKVLLRGLIEFSNYCSSDCLYCGIRKSNSGVHRYRLSEEVILEAVKKGYEKGLKTFVLQSGEDAHYTQDTLCRIVQGIKEVTENSAAVTLSCGIKSRNQFQELRDAGADRYLIRFETSDPRLHEYLRDGVSFKRRMKALEDLREADFDLGSGFMVGLPGETEETLKNNILLCGELNIDMGGIGPFIPHPDTPLKNSPQVPIDLSIRATALLRLMLPHCHIPATTAAGSLDPRGREKMIEAGANILMPNITPVEVKKDYLLYPGKICLDESGFQCIGCQSSRVMSVGKQLSFDRGDALRRAQ